MPMTVTMHFSHVATQDAKHSFSFHPHPRMKHSRRTKSANGKLPRRSRFGSSPFSSFLPFASQPHTHIHTVHTPIPSRLQQPLNLGNMIRFLLAALNKAHQPQLRQAVIELHQRLSLAQSTIHRVLAHKRVVRRP